MIATTKPQKLLNRVLGVENLLAQQMEWMLGVRMMINMMHYGSNNGYFWAGAVKHPRIEETKLETQGKEQYNKHISCQVMKNKLEQRHSFRSLYFEVILLPSEEQELSSVLEQPD